MLTFAADMTKPSFCLHKLNLNSLFLMLKRYSCILFLSFPFSVAALPLHLFFLVSAFIVTERKWSIHQPLGAIKIKDQFIISYFSSLDTSITCGTENRLINMQNMNRGLVMFVSLDDGWLLGPLAHAPITHAPKMHES